MLSPTDPPADQPLTAGALAAFACDISSESDTARIRTVGDLDLATVPILAGHVALLRNTGCRHLTFDLSDLGFIDSTGLRFLLECHAESRQDGFTMALVPGPPAVQMVFELTATRDTCPSSTSEAGLRRCRLDGRARAHGSLGASVAPTTGSRR